MVGEALAQVVFCVQDDLPLHELDGLGRGLAAHNGGHGFDGLAQAGKGHQQGHRPRRQGQQLQRGPGDDAQGALGAHHQILQGKTAGILHRFAAQGEDFPRGQHHLQGAHVVPGDAVLYRAHAPCVGGNISADGGALFAGIRGVEEAPFLHVGRQLHEQHPRLHGDAEVILVQGQHAVHAAHVQQHAAGHRHAGAHQPRARAPGRQGNFMVIAKAHHRGHLCGVLGADHGPGHAANAAEFIVGPVRADGLTPQHLARGQQGFQFRELLRGQHAFHGLASLSARMAWVSAGTIS